ncbi:RWD domain-containing protein 2A-like [Branchiostoma lanceolatum]|uniref:RWD domain-containing protein 2A-like n=1 Tax=Branchiostoma lanceolatum TaxID=7740 RepID=UPI0034514946
MEIRKDLLELQLSELDMLLSMYPEGDEVVLDNPAAPTDIRRFVDGPREAPPPRLEFTLNVEVDEPKATVAMWCSFPPLYPKVLPKIHLRSSDLSRQQQKDINEKLITFLGTLDLGELCTMPVVQWVQENAGKHITLSYADLQSKNTQTVKETNKQTSLSRFWIYSHHIYRQELLRKIPALARELDLTGFCLPGKPGIICVEGQTKYCEEYWHKLRYPNWKHISCKHREDAECKDKNEEASFRLFTMFEELTFEAHGDYGLRNDYHMDLGRFLEYLKEHKCDYMFSIFFGVEGKESPK